MKPKNVIALTGGLMIFAHCKTKQKPVITVTPEPTPAAVPAKTAGETQMGIAGARWPGTSASELKDGQVIYTTKCVKCHRNYDVSEFGEKKWLHEIDDMSPKARLTPEEKLKLTKYILSYRETKEKMKGN